MPNHNNIQIINNLKNAPQPLGPYVQAIDTGDIVFVSGQIGICPDTLQISDNICEQTYQSLQNIRNIIKKVQLQIIHIIKTTLFITNIDDLPEINNSYNNFFNKYSCDDTTYLPARSCVEVTRLPKNTKIQIEAIAKHF